MEDDPRMNRQPIDLGFILRQFPRFEFSMDDFEHRLRVQKFVYLLEAFDVYLGYEYSWYLRGPYCSTLAAAGFALDGFYGRIPASPCMRFSKPSVNERFGRFKEFISGHETDTDFLEMAASIHFLEKGGGLSRDQIFERVLNKRLPGFAEPECRKVQEYLEQWKLIRGVGNEASGREPWCAYGDKPGEEWFAEAPAVPESMDLRPIDKGIYHMLLDSKEGNEKIVLVGKDIFRPDQRRPLVDEITVEDKRLLGDLIERG